MNYYESLMNKLSVLKFLGTYVIHIFLYNIMYTFLCNLYIHKIFCISTFVKWIKVLCAHLHATCNSLIHISSCMFFHLPAHSPHNTWIYHMFRMNLQLTLSKGPGKLHNKRYVFIPKKKCYTGSQRKKVLDCSKTTQICEFIEVIFSSFRLVVRNACLHFW